MSYLCAMKIENNYTTILANLGISTLNGMQIAARTTIIEEQNTILLSPTGSGKTLAFLLPILEILREDIKGIQCLVIVPSRELALQIEQVFKGMSAADISQCYQLHQQMLSNIEELNVP